MKKNNPRHRLMDKTSDFKKEIRKNKEELRAMFKVGMKIEDNDLLQKGMDRDILSKYNHKKNGTKVY